MTKSPGDVFIKMSVVFIIASLLIIALSVYDSVQDGDSLLSGISSGAGILFMSVMFYVAGKRMKAKGNDSKVTDDK